MHKETAITSLLVNLIFFYTFFPPTSDFFKCFACCKVHLSFIVIMGYIPCIVQPYVDII